MNHDTQSQDTQSLMLPARLDAAAGRRLVDELGMYRGRPLQIDAGRVEIVSGLALELLLATAQQWQRDGLPFAVGAASAPYLAACRILALDDGPLMPGAATGPGNAGGEYGPETLGPETLGPEANGPGANGPETRGDDGAAGEDAGPAAPDPAGGIAA